MVERFLQRLGDRAQLASAREELAAVLAAVHGYDVPAEAFVDRIADGLLAGDGPITSLAEVCAADLYLACALGRNDARAVAVFEAELMPVARRALAKVDAANAFVDEAAQRVREKVLVDGAIAQYRGTGPLPAWLRVVATRIALDLKRATQPNESDDAIDQLPAPDDPELAMVWQSCAAEYKAALTAAFARLDAKDRTLLRQRFLDELDIEALGRMYRVHASTISRRLQQITERLATDTRSALMTKLALSESQALSMERMVATQLQLSLPRMLRGGKRS